MKTIFKIFDSHVHVGSMNGRITFEGKQIAPFPNSELKGSEEISKYLKHYNITNCLVVPFYEFNEPASIFEKHNHLVMDCISKLDNIYGALWITPNTKDEQYLEAVFSLATNPKIRAFKTTAELWEDDLTPDPTSWNLQVKINMTRIIDFSAKHNLPIQFHTSGGKTDSSYFVNFFKEYGDTVKIHFVHMGMYVSTHFRFVPLFISWIKSGYPVYCDTSLAQGFAVRWLIEEILQLREGHDRVMFATDEPWGDFQSEYHKITGLAIEDDFKQLILYDNAHSLYG